MPCSKNVALSAVISFILFLSCNCQAWPVSGFFCLHYPAAQFIVHPNVLLVPFSYYAAGHNCSQGQDISSAQRSCSISPPGCALAILVFIKTRGDRFPCI